MTAAPIADAVPADGGDFTIPVGDQAAPSPVGDQAAPSPVGDQAAPSPVGDQAAPSPVGDSLDLRRGRHTTRWIAAVVLALGAVLAMVLATRPQAQVEEAQSQLLGKSAPAIAGSRIDDGAAFSLSSLRGRWVVVNFFASWCGPCQEETPQLVTFAYQHRAPTSAAMVGVVINDSDAVASRWDATVGVTWPVVGDPDGQIALAYGVHGQPETFVIDPSGRVVVYLSGPVTTTGLDTWLSKAQSSEAQASEAATGA